MANEFIIKNGFRSQGNSEISGSLITTSSVTLLGIPTGSTSNVVYIDPITKQLSYDISAGGSDTLAAYSTLTASILSGTTITLPNSLTYISSSTYEYLEVHANGMLLRYDIDFIPITTGSIQFNITIPSGSELIYKSYKRP
jgi:hypothetical protein